MDTIRRNPFTAGSIAMMLFVGLATGALFSRVSAHSWGDDVSYGLPAFADGHMWTLITGAFFAVTPFCYVAVIGSFALLTGFAERRLGTYRTVLACVYSHIVGILGAASLVAVGLGGRWSDAIDVGFSAGAMGAAAIATVTLPRRRRLFARAGLVTYCVVALFVLRQLADLEHLVAVLAGLPMGRTFLRFGRPTGPVPGAIADRAQHLLGTHGGGSLSWMTTWPGTRYLLDREGYLAYRVHAGVAITVGDPVGSPAWQARALAEFTDYCTRTGLVPCGFSVSSCTVSGAVGWRHVQVAEDTLIDLGDLTFRGKAWQDIRTARNRAAKEGIEHRLITLADASPSIIAQVREISASWLRDKPMPELHFTLGGVNEAMDPRVRVGIAVDSSGVIHGVTSWLPILDATGRPRGWTLDMMRRRPDGFRPVIDFLIASACLEFQSEGATVVSLSGAPLARTGGSRTGVMPRLLDTLGATLEPCYGFRSLHAYKAKFQPRREPLHLAYRRVSDLPQIGLAILCAYLSKPTRRLVAHREPVRTPLLVSPRRRTPHLTSV